MFSTTMLQTILNLHPPTRLELLTTEITAAGIHWIALLAATARLFSLLDEQGPYWAVLPAQFKAGVRNIIYSCQGPFALLDGPELIMFLAHCYIHCREALRPLLGETCLPLSQTLPAAEKDQPYFALAIDYSLRKLGIRRSEIKDLALAL